MDTTFEIYKKRSGTSGEGDEYEQLTIAHILLNVFATQTDFQLSANDERGGVFDDVCLEIAGDEKQTTYIQLKHTENSSKTLTPQQLEAKTGDFAVSKYYKSYIEKKIKADRLILLTNRKCTIEENQMLTLAEFKAKVAKSPIPAQDLPNTSDLGYCYQLEADETTDKSYTDFCSKFFIYTSQGSCKQLKRKVRDKFTNLFNSQDGFDKFLNWVKEWWKEDGKVEKINKEWLQKYFALLYYLPRMKAVNFASTTLNKKEQLLKEAISNFEISVFDAANCDKLLKLWSNSQLDNDIKKINRLILRYKFCDCVGSTSELSNESKTILLWLLDLAPLVVTYKNDEKALTLFRPKNIIFLLEGNKSIPSNISHFQNLADIKSCSEIFENIVETFEFSSQSKIFSLNLFLNNDENVMRAFSSDILLEMSSRIISIEGINEPLLDNYQNRNISYNRISIQYFNQQFQSALIMIDFVTNISLLEKRLSNYIFINYESEKLQNLDHTKRIIVYSSQKIGFKDFQSLAQANSKFKIKHFFRHKDKLSFEWMYSESSVHELKHFLSTEFQSEAEIWSSHLDSNLNLLVGNSGMGKTEFLRNFSYNAPAGFWPLLLYAKDINLLIKKHFKSEKDKIRDFEGFILNYKYKNLCKIDKELLALCLKHKKVLCLWDGLDEINSENLQIISDFIFEMSRENYFQFITSRDHLEQQLEIKFNVLSKKLDYFNKNQQDQYLKERLKKFITPETLNEVIAKIRLSFKFIEGNEFFGLPLQIFMLTELLRQNKKYLDQLQNLVLTDLYKSLIEEKFKIFSNKLFLESQRSDNVLPIVKREFYKTHQYRALVALLPENVLKDMNINTIEDDDREICQQIAAGLITDVTKGKARFVHISFAEYFVASFFFENRKQYRTIFQRFIFRPQFRNIRFLFDLLMAKNSSSHKAVLYQNLTFFANCNNREIWSSKDEGGRNLLHLIASWGQPHELFKIEKKKNYTIQHDGAFEKIAENQNYMKIEDIIVNNCNNIEKDTLFEMTPLEYAEKCNCLSVKIKLLLKEGKPQINEDFMVNMLYYASRFHYNDVIELFNKCVHQWYSTKAKILNCRNLKGFNILCISVVSNNYKMVEFLINNHVRVNCDDNFYSPLQLAVAGGFGEIAKILERSGAKMNQFNTLGNEPLSTAVSNGDIKTVRFLVEAGIKINLPDEWGYTPLSRAANNGHIEVIKFLLEKGADNNLADKLGYTPLSRAANNGHIEVVKYMVEKGVNVNLTDDWGYTPLSRAANNGHIEIVKFLLEKGTDINLADEWGYTPLSRAAYNGHIEVVKFLLEKGADINLAKESISALLCKAAFNSHIEIVKFLLEKGVDINLAKESVFTLLCKAAFNGHVDVVKFLVEKGADINLADKSKYTPLPNAAYNGHIEVVKFLVKKGADINLANERGYTALSRAADNGHIEVVKFLLEKGADIDLAKESVSVLLCKAAFNGQIEVVKFLLEKGADINVADACGYTPLSRAADNGHIDIVRFLLEKGADIRLAKESVSVLLCKAAFIGHIEVVKFLPEKGVDLNVADAWGYTPLSRAADSGHIAIVKFLLEKGADINLANKRGYTPLSGAADNGHIKVVKFLLKKGADINLAKESVSALLCKSAFNGHIKIVKFLLEKGADINQADKRGYTPLSGASDKGHIEVVELLLKKGADINLAQKSGNTPLANAASNGQIEVVKFLLEKGADIDLAKESVSALLCKAALNGDIELVKFLLGKGVDINVVEKLGDTPLSNAAQNGHIEVVKFLLKKGADINLANKSGYTPLSTAVFNGQTKVVKFLLKKGADINLAVKSANTSLSEASYNGQIEVVKFLLEKGANINLADESGYTPLSIATFNGQVEVVNCLLEKGANINLADESGDTPLSNAACNGHIEVVRLLVEKGANINLANKSRNTPLSRAAYKGHIGVIKFLVGKGANINLTDQWGYTPISIASFNGQIEVVNFLLEKGANINLADDSDYTPLSIAAANGQIEVVKFLLEKGANINLADKSGNTPLSRAAYKGHIDVVRFLVEKGANINLVNKSRNTPLFRAAYKGHIEVVEFLVGKGADINLSNKSGNTPISIAADNGHTKVVNFLSSLY